MNFYDLIFKGEVGHSTRMGWWENILGEFIGGVSKLIAKFLKIKGNTLVWNQLAQLGAGVANACTKSYDSATGITTITPTNYSSNNVGLYNLVPTSDLKANHKYLVSVEVNPTANLSFSFGFGSNLIIKSLTANNFQRISTILTWSASSLTLYARLLESGWASGTYQMRNAQCFDLTAMFGSGNEPSTVEEFTSLFPLPYYQYEQGKLLSFNGTGIKTTGRNQLLKATQGWSGNGLTTVVNDDGSLTISGTATGTGGYITGVLPMANIIPEGTVISIGFTTSLPSRIRLFAKNNPSSNPTYDIQANTSSNTTAISADLYAVQFYLFTTVDVSYDFTIYPQIEFGSTATEYTEYIESTTSIPTSTYFPTGMKSAGSVYDELTNSKAITRIGSRAYQAGDENDPAVNTDGTTTYYALAEEQVVDITPPLDLSYEVWEGGTEQLLPVNTDVPVTSPILADIKYPNGERDDQYFTYRQYIPII